MCIDVYAYGCIYIYIYMFFIINTGAMNMNTYINMNDDNNHICVKELVINAHYPSPRREWSGVVSWCPCATLCGSGDAADAPGEAPFFAQASQMLELNCLIKNHK